MISLLQFRQLFPSCPKQKAAEYLPSLIASMKDSGIVTRKRAAAYFAQLGHESLDFKYMEEIASGSAYEGRKDLGNSKPGDGKRFKGRGPIQITGRLNYTRAALALSLPLAEQPELLSIPENGFRASAWFWQSNKLNVYADALTGRGDAADLGRFDKITRRINGGYNGRTDRQRRYLVALSILTDEQFADTPQGHTLDELTVPAVPTEPATATSTPETSVQGQQTPATASQTPAPEETSLLDEIPVTEETKSAGASVLRKVGLKIGGTVGTLWAGGIAGKLLLAVALVVVVAVLYYHRRDVLALVRRVLRKLKGGA